MYNKAKTVKEITYFPADYPDFKVIKRFTKPRSSRTRLFATNDPEGWFIDIFSIKTKTGEVASNEGWLTKKDLDQWIDWSKSLGWIEQKV